jgi:hypothetical protein
MTKAMMTLRRRIIAHEPLLMAQETDGERGRRGGKGWGLRGRGVQKRGRK